MERQRNLRPGWIAFLCGFALLSVFANKARILCSNSHIFFITTSHFPTMWALCLITFHRGSIKGIKITKEYWRFEPFVAVKTPDM
jgi:hypothetical protein